MSMTEKQFETLARSLRPALHAAACRITADRMSADDVVQDAMLKLWSLRDRLDSLRSVDAFAMVVVRHLALNSLRSSGTHRLADLADDDISIPSAEEELLEREQRQNVDRILGSLPDAQQTLIRLRHIEGYDNAAIAALLGSTEGAVRTALSRARRHIATIFAATI